MDSTTRVVVTQHWAGKARSPSSGRWLKRALGAARKRDRSTRIAFSGGDYQAYDLIWAVLDVARNKYPDMVLLHGGTPKGAEMIAARWADARGVTQVVFKPDGKSHGKAAPFKRNDKMLEIPPQGLIATPGSGITEDIVDKARKLGIRVKRIGV